MSDNRSSAIYIAKVIAIGDEKTHKGKLKLKLKNTSIWSHSFWASPVMHPNITWVPDRGELVFVFFESGEWADAYWFGSEGTFGAEVSGKEYPQNRVIKTKKGHSIELSDSESLERISVKSAPKNGKQHELTLNSATEEIVVRHSSGRFSMTVTPAGNLEIVVDAVKLRSKDIDATTGEVNLQAGGSVRVKDSNGNEILMSDSGVQIVDKNRNVVRLRSNGVEIRDKSSSKIVMSEGRISIEAKGDIVLNGGTQGVVRAGDISAPHTHIITTPSGPGTASPATVAFTKAGSSKKVRCG